MKSLSGVLLVCYCMAVCDSWVPILFKRRVCYEEIGCFENTSPFNNALSFLPRSPSEIDVMYQLFTRKNRDSHQTLTTNTNTIRSSNFNGDKATKFIIHGYLDNAASTWVTDMKDAILQREDANVITVDWSKGANQANYVQVVANTRVVGALLSLLMNTLDTVANGSSLARMHLIGHSLGAHVAGYAGERTLGTGRITGLDPAGPLFKQTSSNVRLDPSDALFVDVIHTNANGFGIKYSVGHVDFYPNGGKRQPGCLENMLSGLFSGQFEQLFHGVACSHMRVLNLFTESINSNCQFSSYPCKWCTTCGSGCANMGYDAPQGNPRGDYFLSTNSQHPFCTA
ncbi:hypothetical protein ACJMK2_042537 [Sinanodonta woodiana]|uniref:Lipase domain-containing protein n=1 Tax=Sinanodonta woodiana TaxID=1069815 RepID=A0ABD3W7N2_SINWO